MVRVVDCLVTDAPPPLRRRRDRWSIRPGADRRLEVRTRVSRHRGCRVARRHACRHGRRGDRHRLLVDSRPQERQDTEANQQGDQTESHARRDPRPRHAPLLRRRASSRFRAAFRLCCGCSSARLGAALRLNTGRSSSFLRATLCFRGGTRFSRPTSFPSLACFHQLALVLKTGFVGICRHGCCQEGTRISPAGDRENLPPDPAARAALASC